MKLHNGQPRFSSCQLQKISEFLACTPELFRNFLPDSLSVSPSFYWQEVANKLQLLKKNLAEELSALREIRQTVLQLTAPPQLVCAFY